MGGFDTTLESQDCLGRSHPPGLLQEQTCSSARPVCSKPEACTDAKQLWPKGAAAAARPSRDSRQPAWRYSYQAELSGARRREAEDRSLEATLTFSFPPVFEAGRNLQFPVM